MEAIGNFSLGEGAITGALPLFLPPRLKIGESSSDIFMRAYCSNFH
jgi:hypothetical protein